MQKNCRQCNAIFEITDNDLAFYDKISPVFPSASFGTGGGKKYLIPPPTLCPDCRQQRRLAFRNERKLYHRKCDLCGHQLISIYSPDPPAGRAGKPYKVYCPDCFYGDRWEALDYGRDFDFNKTFFEQFKEFQLQVPMLSSILQKENENCDYTNLTSNNRNCYLIFAANMNEDCYYCTYIHKSRNTSDCFFVFDLELCYECIDCYNSNRLFYAQFCSNCHTSAFLYDCKNCGNCLGCAGLNNKKNHILNKACSEKEVKETLNKILTNRLFRQEFNQKFLVLKEKNPHKYYQGLNNENITGDHISFSKNAVNCFDCTYLEDCKNCTWMHQSKDCQDCYAWGQTGELGYENHVCGNNFYNVQFSDSCWNDVANLLYCRGCINNAKNLFGCISLFRKQYCILNKQYTKEEYEKLVPKIIEHMKRPPPSPLLGKGGGIEWGEFFPISLSPFCYNETVAQEYFPLTKEQVRKLGADWRKSDPPAQYTGPIVNIPDSIEEVPDNILNQILVCETCKKNYKIIPQELRLYRTLGVPIPKNCFNCRYEDRFSSRNPRKLWKRNCMKCGAEMMTTYPPERKEKVYCEKCYLETVY